MKKLGDVIQSALEMRDLTQKQAADDLNITPQTFNSYVKNHRYPDMDVLRSIAIYLELDMNSILGLHPDEDSHLISDRNEAMLIKNFRSLNEHEKEILIGIVKLMSETK